MNVKNISDKTYLIRIQQEEKVTKYFFESQNYVYKYISSCGLILNSCCIGINIELNFQFSASIPTLWSPQIAWKLQPVVSKKDSFSYLNSLYSFPIDIGQSIDVFMRICCANSLSDTIECSMLCSIPLNALACSFFRNWE